MTRYYFTNEEGAEISEGFYKNMKEARKKAQYLAIVYKSDIFINKCEGETIEDVIFYEAIDKFI